MFDLRALDGTNWLCEPLALQRLIAHVQSFPGCYSGREVAKFRRRRLERAQQPDTVQCSDAGGWKGSVEPSAGPRAIRAQGGRVGVIGVHGPIDQRVTSALEKAGGTSCEEVSYALDALLADQTVSAIVLHVDSPGGAVSGVAELCDKVYAARAKKPIYCSIDSTGASAAYWIATAAETVTMTPGGYCGSVGVFSLHIDQTAALAEQGVKVSMVQAGRYKTEFLDVVSLSDEARGYLQTVVDAIYDKFVVAVARNRERPKSQVISDFGQGRVMDANAAMAAGMVDRIISFEDLMARLTGGGAPGGGSRSAAAASVEVLRLRHQWAKQRTRELHLGVSG